MLLENAEVCQLKKMTSAINTTVDGGGSTGGYGWRDCNWR
ncbi:hypothetical protein ACNKHL_13550 [Shigella flexneri]